jgi:hypothetical protein
MTRRTTVPFLVALALTAAIALAGCDDSSGGSSGGITIPSSDSSNPTLSLGVGATDQATAKATVNSGGSGAAVALDVKTGSLNLAATAKDPESGVQKVEIWMQETETRCSGGTCSQSGPALLGGPLSTAGEPPKQPGATTTETSLLADVVDLPTHVGSAPAGETYLLKWEFWAEARNHLGGTVKTPTITVTYDEP